ncbi:MAG: hypothetical protein ACXQTS_06280 [Candidatus Methanospirareceae archaeon]
MHRILIVGFKERDAGKTSLALAFLGYLKGEGFIACGFKPCAGNNVWYDYDIVEEALSQGRLYGKDAKLLTGASIGENLQEELINPFHRLWDERPRNEPISQIPYFIVDRITLWEEEKKDIVIENNASPFIHGPKRRLLKKLYTNASRIYKVNNIEELNMVIEKYYDKAIRSAFTKIDYSCDFLIIESYSDVALPWSGIRELDLVIGIEPWKIHVYDADRYLKAVQLAMPTYSQREISTYTIKELVEPIRSIEIPPFKSYEVVKKLKEKIPMILEGLS